MSGESTENWSEPMDRPEHEKTYDVFINLVKYITLVCVIILILMAIFLV